MSLHKIKPTEHEEEGLKLHELPVGTPSQLSDCFRNGFAWANHCAQAEVENIKAERDALLEERKEQLVKNVFDSSDKKLMANHGFNDFIELLSAYEKLLAERNEFENAYRDLFNSRANRVQDLQQKVWVAMDKKSCPGVFMQIACDAILENGCAEVADLKGQIDRLLAERDQMMKQEPVGYTGSGSIDAVKVGFEGHLFGSKEASHPIPLYAHPLPAQQIPDTLSSDDFVPMPSNADQASWMMAIGESWLERNAPERLNPHRVGLHIDDFAVNQFADSMKKKLAISREKGKSGWNDPLSCKVSYLAELLISHLPKGDPVDVANFAMMLHLRDGGHEALKEAAKKIKQIPEGYALTDEIRSALELAIELLNDDCSFSKADALKAMLSASQQKGE